MVLCNFSTPQLSIGWSANTWISMLANTRPTDVDWNVHREQATNVGWHVHWLRVNSVDQYSAEGAQIMQDLILLLWDEKILQPQTVRTEV